MTDFDAEMAEMALYKPPHRPVDEDPVRVERVKGLKEEKGEGEL